MPINDRTIDKLKLPLMDFQAVDVNHARALYVYAISGKFNEFSRLAIHAGYCGYVNRIGIRVAALSWCGPPDLVSLTFVVSLSQAQPDQYLLALAPFLPRCFPPEV
jgi:hypothetical protein